MKFDKYFPCEQLRPYIRYFAVSENEVENEYKVFPSPGLVIGFQYKGRLALISGNAEVHLATAGITGISDSYKIFKTAAQTGTVLVYFTETGFTHFASLPANELSDLSLSLENIFQNDHVRAVEDKLASAITDKQRIQIVEQFLLSQLKDVITDKLVAEAVYLIFQSKGCIRIKDLNKKLFISQSPFEKRFRKVVGTTAKRFASIVRFNNVLENLGSSQSLPEICYENHFFDQSHFIKDFRQFTGDTPESFKRSL